MSTERVRIVTDSACDLPQSVADELGIERKGFATLWVVDFPMFTYDAEEESLPFREISGKTCSGK